MKKLYVNENLVAMGNYILREEESPAKYTVRIVHDYDYQMSDYPELRFYSNHRDYRFDGMVDDELVQNLFKKEVDGKHYYPVYAYQHSGISLYKSRYTGPDSMWDSGLFGIAEVECEESQYSDSIFDSFFTELKASMEGEVYEFQILDELGDIVDSCYGFYGKKKDIIDSMFEFIPESYGISRGDLEKAFENRYE